MDNEAVKREIWCFDPRNMAYEIYVVREDQLKYPEEIEVWNAKWAADGSAMNFYVKEVEEWHIRQ